MVSSEILEVFDLGRFEDIAPEDLTPEQRAVLDRIASGPRGRIPLPFRIWVHSPDLLARLEQLGLHFRDGFALTERQKEIAILVGARHWGAAFEWWMHGRHAAARGIDQAVVVAIEAGEKPPLDDPAERLVHDLAQALHDGGVVDAGLHGRAVDVLGHRGVADLTSLLGYYTTVAFTLNFYDVPAPGGGER